VLLDQRFDLAVDAALEDRPLAPGGGLIDQVPGGHAERLGVLVDLPPIGEVTLRPIGREVVDGAASY
jgi:hypothetical protein